MTRPLGGRRPSPSMTVASAAVLITGADTAADQRISGEQIRDTSIGDAECTNQPLRLAKPGGKTLNASRGKRQTPRTPTSSPFRSPWLAAAVLVALTALAVVGPALSAPSSSTRRAMATGAGCVGSVKTTDAQGSVVNQNSYAAGDDVYLQGSGFPAGAVLSYTIDQTNGPAAGPSGSFGAGANGSFLKLVWRGAAAAGEFKVEVTYVPAGRSQSCKKSDNFKIRAATARPVTTPVTIPVVTPVATPVITPVTTPPGGVVQAVPAAFSCRASAARLRTSTPLPSILLEPAVANPADAPCATASKALLTPTRIGPVSAAALSADTTLSASAATASSRVADVGVDLSSPSTVALPLLPPLQLPGLLPVAVTLTTLNSSAGYTCQNGQPVASGASEVVGLSLKVLGLSVPINIPNPSQPLDIDLGGLLAIHLNQQVVTPTTLTRRALYITSATLGIELSLAESTVDIAGNPCGTAALAVTPPTPTPPLVVPVAIPSVPGTAKLAGVPPAGALATGPFSASVLGRQIASVTFTLDGTPVPGAGPLTARIASGSLPSGTHTLRARVTFTKVSGTAPRTLTTGFRTRTAAANSGSGPSSGGANPTPAPRFTG